ncbi:hypothetical protein [Nonomuraea sp. SYSU D8015]|uniref:hypothetical protein n=1 Tax=Nonomuraea sp. SYSU D8015 TaxID=2593644 RepID=UPI0016614885|nr:hypothetical protein [Nonomuraea sp. SYSU D8015]
MSDNASVAATAKVFVSYNTILIKALGEVDYTDPPSYAPNGLVAAHLDAAAIFTGVHTGYVTVTVQTTTSAPRLEGVRKWADVEEVVFPTSIGDMRLFGFMGDTPPPDLPSLTPQGPGVYTLRLHASTRPRIGTPETDEPVEEYLVCAWPLALGRDAAIEAAEDLTNLTSANVRAYRERLHSASPGRTNRSPRR